MNNELAPELSKSYEPSVVETRWSREWIDRGYFTADPGSGKPPYCIVLPPPNVTGSLHLGHALTATIQDILIRYKRMTGHEVLWVPGTDHAGIATQMVVERELLKAEKVTRHQLGREEFLRRVWAWKETYGARIGEQHKLMGASLDWSRERFTMDPGLSDAVKEVFVRLHEEGLIYRARKLINWDPQLRTALSDLEVENEDRPGSLWSIAYPVKDSDERLTVATTRPETMLGDTAVAVHPDDERYRHLIGKRVVLPLIEREIPIIGDAELVDPTFGTGVVKVTPAHDHNDYATGLRHGLPMVNIFTETAVVNENGGPYQGLDRFAARARVLEDLTAKGLLVEEKPHTVPLAISQRTGVPVEPRLSWQWYVKVQPLADAAVAAVEQGKTRFVPESWTGTFFHWMRNIHDWCISRQLWWGHQIPAWYEAAEDGTVDFETARVVVARQRPAEGTWVQDPDVLDTWFSSGLWPFSTLGWPKQTPELSTFYPNAVMETGHDIIFFWVARMMMMGLHFMGDVPFRTVFLHAMVRDEKGEKMSKTKGNVIDPLDIVRGAAADALPASVKNRFPKGLEAMGADALRFTLAALTQQGRDIKLSVDRIAGYRAFCNKVWNAARFALMNMGAWHDDGARFITERPLSLADRWILSRLDATVHEVRAALDGYEFSTAASAVYQFLWRELCDWYIELAKPSLASADEAVRDSTRAVLVYCLDTVLRLAHPFMPFITEEIWQKLPIARPTPSICIASYPAPDTRLRDERAEAEMAPLIEAIEGIRTIRGESNLSPALKLVAVIHSADAAIRETLERWRGYVLPLAGLKELVVGAPGEKPRQAAAEVRGQLEIFVPLAGVVDLGEERERLGKEIDKAKKEIAQIEKKFENPNFVARAPPDVVEKDRARIAELTARIAKLSEGLERLSEPAPPEGGVDLREELRADLEQVVVPAPDQETDRALQQLRAGTPPDMSSQDHRDLDVAYMSMGLVDDAVREFTRAADPAAAAPDAPVTPGPRVSDADPGIGSSDTWIGARPPPAEAEEDGSSDTRIGSTDSSSGSAATAAPAARPRRRPAPRKSSAKKAPSRAKPATRAAKKPAVKRKPAKSRSGARSAAASSARTKGGKPGPRTAPRRPKKPAKRR